MMTKKQFKHDFLRGLGSALLALKTCGNPQQHYDIVRYGCLHNTTYDAQCEGDRGWYLHQAAAIVGGGVLKNVIERYSCNTSDHWLFDQLTSILFHYAKDGNEAAHAALHDKYNFLLGKLSRMQISRCGSTCPNRDMFDWLCVWLTSLDGWNAFKRIINDISEGLLPKDADFFFSEWFYDNSKNKFGKKRVEAYLQKQAGQNERIERYWEKAQEWDAHVYEKRPAPTLEDVVEGATGEKFRGRGISMQFARNASSAELGKLLQIAIAEQNLQKKAELLWGLRKATARIPEEVIAELLKSENEDIRDTAFYIMENHPSSQMREYALSCLQMGEDVVNAVSLLSKNILPQDELLLCDAVKSIPVKLKESDWHSAFMAAEDGVKNLHGKPKTDLLQYIYRETYCGSCRASVVRLMHKKKLPTYSLLQECLHDSNDDIRDSAKRIITRRTRG
ncbi:MAG: hypothetical protein FWC27_08900 [Firmicutes bacterium]|nr:hypothetical protein [Bacillota bacterium]